VRKIKREGFVAFPCISKKDGRRGTFEEQRCQEMSGGPGADFLRGVAFWSIRSSVLGR